jgi:hypothetical protein
MRKEDILNNMEIKDHAIHLAVEFMDKLAPGSTYSFDEFMCEFDHAMTEDERSLCSFLLSIIVDEEAGFKDSLIAMLKKYPNDADLGEAIRKLYNSKK